jgi:hypothetical protein
MSSPLMSSPLLRPALVVALALAASCEPLTEPAPTLPAEGRPDAFRMRVDGYGYGAHIVTLRGDTLVVERRPEWRIDSAQITRVVPSSADWAAFWRAANDAGVRAWPRRCLNDRVADGGGYTLEIAYAGAQLTSSGTNSYPRRDGRCSEADGTEEYRVFVGAVSALIGRAFP